MTRALRYQLPGPGAYSPDRDGRPHGTSQPVGYPSGATWARDDRMKHLTRTNRPRGQYTALPLRCGPAPGFYSNPVYPAPKERAARGNRCRARMFRPAADLPAGQPPERNRVRVEEARLEHREADSGPGPAVYNPEIAMYSEFQNKLAGRWTAKSKLGASASTSALEPLKLAEDIDEGEEGEDGFEIERQAKGIQRRSRDRRLDLRRREVVEDELDRVRQKHRLLAAGAKRSIGKSHESAQRPPESAEAVIAMLRHRLDGSLQRMSDLFRAIDSSWDGAVSRAELGMALRALGIDVTGEELRALFGLIDTDDSGEIDFRELKRALAHRVQSPKKRETGAGAEQRLLAVQRAVSEAQLVVAPRRLPAANKPGPWALGSGRDLSTLLLNGIEPPDRRSLGPATYDPRPAVAAVKPSVSVGGDVARQERKLGSFA